MDFLVLLQITWQGEGLVEYRAPVRFFPRVNPHMQFKPFCRSESLVALIAEKWLLSRVLPLVVF